MRTKHYIYISIYFLRKALIKIITFVDKYKFYRQVHFMKFLKVSILI